MSARERVRELAASWEQGTLDPAGADELRRLLEEDEAARREVLDGLEIHGMLGQLRAAGEGEVFRRSLLERLAAEDSSSRFMRALAERQGGRARRRSRRGRPPSRGVLWISIAAAAFVAVVGFAALPRPRPSRAPEPLAGRPAPPPENPPGRVSERIPRVEKLPGRISRAEPAPPPPPPVPRAEEPPPAPRPEPPPVPAPVPPPPAPESVPAVAVLDAVQGDARTGRGAAKSGDPLTAGEGLRTAAGGAALRFPDGTRIELRPESEVREVRVAGRKTLVLAAGSIAADVSRQPQGAPLVVTSHNASATVVGTRFALSVSPDATRLEVAEGRVRLARLEDGASAVVGPGQFAEVRKGAPPAARPIPVDEIVLLPRQGKIVGPDWRLARDEKASSGWALEAPADRRYEETYKALKGRRLASHVEFAFAADAGREYRFWMRGTTLAAERPDWHDCAALELAGVDWVKDSRWALADGVGLTFFNGFGLRQSGYGWIGGDKDNDQDRVPVTVRFQKAGRQTIRLYAVETPIRIDAIWITTTQATRPEPNRLAPAPEGN